MHVIGRWEKVRSIGVGPSLPYIYDKKWRQLNPYRHDQWWRSPEGLWIPVIQGGALNGSYGPPRQVIWADGLAAGGTCVLNSAYTKGSAGAATGNRFLARTTTTVDEVYWLNAAMVGGGTRTVQWDLFADSSNKPAVAGSPIQTGNFSVTATGWQSMTGITGGNVTAGSLYWNCLADTAADGTHYTQPYVNCTQAGTMGNYGYYPNTITANGWSTVTRQTSHGAICCKFGDGKWLGCPYVITSNSTNNQERKGWYLSNLSADIKLFAMLTTTQSANISGIELYSGATLPGGTADASSTTPWYDNAATPVPYGYFFNTAPTLTTGTNYRVVFTFGGNLGHAYVGMGTSPPASLVTALSFAGGAFYWTWANGTTDWSKDVTTAIPQTYQLIFEDWSIGSGAPAATGGGPLVGGRLVG